jgi:hypothetical protein
MNADFTDPKVHLKSQTVRFFSYIGNNYPTSRLPFVFADLTSLYSLVHNYVRVSFSNEQDITAELLVKPDQTL